MFGGKVEFGLVDSAGLGAEKDALAPAAGERAAEDFFAFFDAVVGAGVDQIDAAFDGGVKGVDGGSFVDVAVDAAERSRRN